jgi:MATE family multidrug resistance protein
MQAIPLSEEPRGEGVREVSVMAGPIVIAALSFVAMDFADKYMVSVLGTENLAAVGSSSLWAYSLTTFILGVVGCVSTFVSQSIGRGDEEQSGSYIWAGIYVSMTAGALALLLYPVAPSLFALMQHTPEVTQLELDYFNVRLLGFLPAATAAALMAFYQGINRTAVMMCVMVIANIINIAVNYALIYGKLGAPEMGIVGAAWGNVLSQFAQAVILLVLMLRGDEARRYNTRASWRFDAHRFFELLRIGYPAGICMFLDIATWGIFISFVIGYFGDVALAATNAAVAIMYISFVPAIALNQAIAPIVGKWIGCGDIPRAKARTFTALKIGGGYMLMMGTIFAIFGGGIIGLFTEDPDVISMGWKILMLAAFYQLSDSTGIIVAGALRGAGDTRFVMWATVATSYGFFLPMATFLALVFPGGPFWAWVGAAIYIVVLGMLMLWRFNGERWKHIQIFVDDQPAPATQAAA